MTPAEARTAAAAHVPELAAQGAALEAMIRHLEAVADGPGAHRRAAEAVLTVHAWRAAEECGARTIAGVRVEQLVRWDGHTTTWLGTDTASGRSVMARVLRDPADPVLARALARDGRALARVHPFEIRESALVVALPTNRSATPWVRRLAGGLASLAAYDAHSLALPPLAPQEFVQGPDGLEVVCLTPRSGTDQRARVSELAQHVLSQLPVDEETATGRLVVGLAQAPVEAAEAQEQLLLALRDNLAAQWHVLRARAKNQRRSSRAGRLHTLIGRLSASLRPPEGRGALGVDLDGHIIVLETDRGGISLRTNQDPPQTVWLPDGDFDAPLARQVLRIRARTTSSEALQHQVHGDADYVEQSGRWIAAALKLRTERKLIEQRVPDV